MSHNCIAYHETSKFDVPEPSPVVEPEVEEVSFKAGKVPRIQGFDKNKTNIALMLVVLSVLSVVILFFWSGNRGLEAVQPLVVDYELHSMALGQVNVFRARYDLADLEYNVDSVAQEWAWRLMKEGDLYHNPDLPSYMGENIAVYTENGIDPKVAIALIVDRMVNNDSQFSFANRGNVLDPDYGEVAIGVAVDGDSVYLVLCFS